MKIKFWKKEFWFFAVIIFCFLMLLTKLNAANNISITKTNYPGGRMYTFIVELDSADIDTSAMFSLSEFDNLSWATYPFTYQLDVTWMRDDTVRSTAMDTVNVGHYIDGTMDGGVNWTVVDTVKAFAALKFIDTTLSGTMDWNNLKYPYYRMRAVELAKQYSDTIMCDTVRIWMYQDK